VDARSACVLVRRRYGSAIRRDSIEAPATSHGAQMARALGLAGARGEAASGFRSVRTWSLPAYRATIATTGDRERAGVQALFTLIAHVADTNIAWRGGIDALAWAQRQAAHFLDEGGVLASCWRARAIDLHHAFVARRLSPGGSADLLAVTFLLHALDA
jgi:triphosphoribosyl-dephospho-CoA synthase